MLYQTFDAFILKSIPFTGHLFFAMCGRAKRLASGWVGIEIVMPSPVQNLSLFWTVSLPHIDPSSLGYIEKQAAKHGWEIHTQSNFVAGYFGVFMDWIDSLPLRWEGLLEFRMPTLTSRCVPLISYTSETYIQSSCPWTLIFLTMTIPRCELFQKRIWLLHLLHVNHLHRKSLSPAWPLLSTSSSADKSRAKFSVSCIASTGLVTIRRSHKRPAGCWVDWIGVF